MKLRTRPLHPRFGFEILDIDLRALNETELKAINALWIEHPVILIRNQLLDETEQIHFSKQFGEINIHVRTDI